MDDEKKRESVENYIAFKNLMFKIDKDEDEYDDDGNLIPNHPQVSAKELQNLGMPSAGSRANHGGDYNTRGSTNGYSAPPPPNLPNPASLPPAMRGMNPTQFNPVIRLQNVPLSSLPGHQLPDGVATRPSRESARTSSSSVSKIPDVGGYLDPETGDWVSTNSRGDVSNSEEENSRHGSSRSAKNTQESQKVPKLTINLGPKKPTEHAFFAELDKNSRERDQRRGKKSHKEKHREKHKKKKKKKYQSDSGDSSDSGSDIEFLS